MSRAQPFIKWAGGKRQLLPAILSRMPSGMGTYYEPFIGGGAVFFVLDAEDAFDQAIIGDCNPELINAYSTLSDLTQLETVITLLKGYPYDRTFYEEMRKKKPADLTAAERAARFIYLNRTGFNGLYRVNKKGEFNVPFGKYTNPTICDEANLRQVSGALRQDRVTCRIGDFEAQVVSAKAGDMVYFDPPYMPLSITSSFTEYMAGGFTLTDQERLARCFKVLADRGVGVLLSNSDTPKVRELYAGFQQDVVSAKRSINAKADRRGPVSELLIHANLR